MHFLALQFEASPHSNDHQVRPVIDGIDLLRDFADDSLGIDPPQFFRQPALGRSGKLLIGRCSCGDVGCGAFRVDVTVADRCVIGKLADNPVLWVDKPKIDRRPKIRFLDQQEESRLRAALSARDAEMREARDAGNQWRGVRQYELLPSLPHFADHLTPAVLLSMNTGLRRGELLGLRWDAVDFDRRILTVEGGTSKSRQTRHVALNDEAIGVLHRWREQACSRRRIFEVRTGFKTAWAKLLKRANITKFRWHDLRHHFASRLVQLGVPLNTVRYLLGHSSVAMSLRYAHLAPDQRREAVTRLAAKRPCAATRHPQWDFDPNTEPRTD